MKKFKFLISMTALSIISSNAFSTEQWLPETTYNSGNIVEWKGESYVASHWTQGTEPEPNNINWDGWIHIDKDRLEEWSMNTAYAGGSLVNINEQLYLAKWWSQKTPSEF